MNETQRIAELEEQIRGLLVEKRRLEASGITQIRPCRVS